MRRLLFSTIYLGLLFGCTDKPAHDKAVVSDITASTDDPANIYIDSSQSKFEIISKDTNNGGYLFRTIETNYKLSNIALQENLDHSKYYIAKYTTTTKSCTAVEGQERTIKVELCSFEDPKTKLLTMEHDCDDLTLDYNRYRTVKYGCCAEEDQLAIYDYNNKLIVEGDSKILLGYIPNSPLDIYVAYKSEYKDTTILGTLYYCYSSSDKYAITIKSRPLPPDNCSPFSPHIFINTSSKEDKFREDDNEYSFWSLNKVENKRLISNLVLKVVYSCDETLNPDTISIPIINGKPFGKDERSQVVRLPGI